MIDGKYWDDAGAGAPSADTAIDTARDQWQRMYREAEAAGREIPVVDVPASLGDVARTSVEATTDLARRARSRSWVVNVDIRALEAAYHAELARQAAQAAAEAAVQAAAPPKHSRRSRRPTGARREVTRRAEQGSR